jgi:hypothetical protein
MERICSQPGRSKPADGGVTQSEQQSAALALSLGAVPNALSFPSKLASVNGRLAKYRAAAQTRGVAVMKSA